MGDAHAAQGDSELDGTAVETSITARVKVTLHKKASLPKLVQVCEGLWDVLWWASAGQLNYVYAVCLAACSCTLNVQPLPDAK